MSEENKPLLSDTMIRSRALAYTSPYDREVQRTANWVREIYEAQRSKDRELIQRFVDHNEKWLGKGCIEADREWDAIVSDAALALAGEQGYKPTDPNLRPQ